MMKRHLLALAVVGVVAGVISAGAARLAAQTADKPSVTVVTFTAERGVKRSSPEEGAVIADELARQLVEAGHYRVLQREWLPVAQRTDRPSTDELRKAAASADVRYLVTGVLGEARHTVRPQGPAAKPTPVPLTQARFGLTAPLPGFRPIPNRRIPPPPRTPAPRKIEQHMTTLNIEVIDVASGKVVMRTYTERAILPPVASATMAIGSVVGGPVGTVLVAASAAKRLADLDKLDTSVQLAIADVARALTSSAALLVPHN